MSDAPSVLVYGLVFLQEQEEVVAVSSKRIYRPRTTCGCGGNQVSVLASVRYDKGSMQTAAEATVHARLRGIPRTHTLYGARSLSIHFIIPTVEMKIVEYEEKMKFVFEIL